MGGLCSIQDNEMGHKFYPIVNRFNNLDTLKLMIDNVSYTIIISNRGQSSLDYDPCIYLGKYYVIQTQHF